MGLAAATALATGLGHVDEVIRTTMLPGAPPLFQGASPAPFQFHLKILGQELHADFSAAAHLVQETAALAATPPAPVRLALWFWLQMK